jgi:hypothetical protein
MLSTPSQGDSINVQLSHVVPDSKVRAVFLRKREGHDIPEHPGETVTLETTIRSGRNQELKVNETSFELMKHPTALATEEFYSNSAKVQSEYYEEIAALLTKVTGSPHVKVFHHQVRSESRQDNRVLKDGSINTSTSVQPYAHGIHTDSSCYHAETMFKQMVLGMPDECRQGRFMYINAWRNISETPIEDNHLAVLDERSLVKPDDYIQQNLFGVGYDVLQYVLSARNANSHKWYYFPKMTKDEVILFKQWDSDPSKEGRVCFHTAVKDPSDRTDAPCRESIEVRAFVFFPDHRPNTCPMMPLAASSPCVEGECDEARAETGAAKLVAAVSHIQKSDSLRSMVVGFMASMYKSGGPKAVLTEFAEDRQGHLDLAGASAETKARAVELALEKGLGKRIDALFADSSAFKLAFSVLRQSRIFAAIAGAIVALAANALVKHSKLYRFA